MLFISAVFQKHWKKETVYVYTSRIIWIHDYSDILWHSRFTSCWKGIKGQDYMPPVLPNSLQVEIIEINWNKEKMMFCFWAKGIAETEFAKILRFWILHSSFKWTHLFSNNSFNNPWVGLIKKRLTVNLYV